MSKKVVLVAEDHQETRDLFEILLRQEGYTVMTASDGQEALDLVRHFLLDAMLVDLMMPRVDGVELIRRVRRELNRDSLPIIALSASEGDHFTRAREAGATLVTRKPYEPRVVVDLLRLALGEESSPEATGAAQAEGHYPGA